MYFYNISLSGLTKTDYLYFIKFCQFFISTAFFFNTQKIWSEEIKKK